MSGNVGEMCWDFHKTYSTAKQSDLPGDFTGTYRVGCGGCWYFGTEYLRASFRAYIEPARRYSYVGFRLARNKH
jgi:formylglycine-generating enzyme required for sulfatase activity